MPNTVGAETGSPLSAPLPASFRVRQTRRMRQNRRLGGLARTRTGVQGFAVLCVTTPPRGPVEVTFDPRLLDRVVAKGNSRAAAGRSKIAEAPSACGRRSDRGQGCAPTTPCCMAAPAFRGSSVVEQPAVNRLVVGSNPTRGASSNARPPCVAAVRQRALDRVALLRPRSPYPSRSRSPYGDVSGRHVRRELVRRSAEHSRPILIASDARPGTRLKRFRA